MINCWYDNEKISLKPFYLIPLFIFTIRWKSSATTLKSNLSLYTFKQRVSITTACRISSRISVFWLGLATAHSWISAINLKFRAVPDKVPSHLNAEWTNSIKYVHIWRPAHQMTWQRLKLAHFLRGLVFFFFGFFFQNKTFCSDYPPRISPFSLCMPFKWLPWENGKPLIYPSLHDSKGEFYSCNADVSIWQITARILSLQRFQCYRQLY